MLQEYVQYTKHIKYVCTNCERSELSGEFNGTDFLIYTSK